MRNFVFYKPTKIIFGRDTIPQIGKETVVFGKKVLFVYGKGSIKKNGIYDQVMKSFQDAGITAIEHGGVKSNPVLSHVREGIKIAKENRVEAVAAVGGGSVIDSAKAIAAGAVVEHDVWKFFRTKKSIKKVLPLTCVLTLAASGSEMNGGMVVTNEETLQKFGIGNHLLQPLVSILDPSTTFTVGPDYTAYGAVDALSHILEFYFTTREPYTPVQDRLMEGLVINIMESCNRVMARPDDYNARADFMWCATLALNGLTAAGLGRVGFPMHLIEHSLSAIYDVPHGAGLSVVMPGWMTHQAHGNPARFAQLAERVFYVKKADESKMAAYGIAELKAWFEKISCPTDLGALQIPEQDIPRIAENTQGLAKVWRLEEYTKDKVEAILRLCT
ncbi:MAG: iron-containing alcohol dehydrogenase [Desulfobulbaceae bacterium]|nr:iron-containing alcohol dehydrogenase [Desulfobulbaceae bacterium]